MMAFIFFSVRPSLQLRRTPSQKAFFGIELIEKSKRQSIWKCQNLPSKFHIKIDLIKFRLKLHLRLCLVFTIPLISHEIIQKWSPSFSFLLFILMAICREWTISLYAKRCHTLKIKSINIHHFERLYILFELFGE